MTPLQMQRTLVSAFKAEQSFLRPRKQLVPLVKNFPGSQFPIRSIDFLLDRFILTSHDRGTVSLWAVSGDASCYLYAQMPQKRGWSAAVHHVSADKSTFFLVCQNNSHRLVCCCYHGTCLSFLNGRIRIYTVTLEAEVQDHPLFMECIADLASDPSLSASGIVPESNLVLLYACPYGRPFSIGILNWQTKQRASVQMDTLPGEPVRSYTVSQRFASFTWLSAVPLPSSLAPLWIIHFIIHISHH